MSRFINTDVPFFLDSGEVNALGTVYFGLPNQDAKTNVKTPYLDAALTLPAATTQTLTSGGKVAQKLYLDGDYSFIVDDVDGVPVFEDLSGAILGATNITVEINGTDRLLQDYLDNQTQATYALLRTALAASDYVAGDVVKVTGSGITGDFVIEAIGSNVDNAGTIITGGSFAAVRGFSGSAHLDWWAPVGDGVADDTAKFTSASAAASVVIVSASASGYVSSGASVGTTAFVFLGDLATELAGTDTADDLNAIGHSAGAIYGYSHAPELKDKGIEIICGTIRQEQPTAVAGITRSGTSGIVNEVAHGRAVGDFVFIQGAVETGYNGTAEIAQVDNVDTYRVLVDSGLTTPATGTITVFGTDVWEWIKDSSHEPLGVNDSVPVRSDASGYGLLVPFTKTYSKVLTMMVGPDETIAGAQGMVIGSSVSTSAIAFRASLNKTVAGRVYWNGVGWKVSMGTDQGTIYTTNAVNPLADMSYSAGNLELSHSFCLGSDVSLTPSSTGGIVPYIPSLKVVGDNTATVNFIYVNGGALDLYTGAETTSMSFNFNKNSNRLIKFDGSDRSSEARMYFGNIWFYGIMQL